MTTLRVSPDTTLQGAMDGEAGARLRGKHLCRHSDGHAHEAVAAGGRALRGSIAAAAREALLKQHLSFRCARNSTLLRA